MSEMCRARSTGAKAMTDRLHELAKLWGVETTSAIPYKPSGQFGSDPDAGEYAPLLVPRPRLDIAHDLLAKLPVGMESDMYIQYQNPNSWEAKWPVVRCGHCGNKGRESVIGTFESAVIALAERAKP